MVTVSRKKSFNPISSYCFYIVVFLLPLMVYGSSLSHDFVWDDYLLITDNEAIKTLSFRSLSDSFFSKNVYNTAEGEIYRPFYIISFALNYYFAAHNPWGYHLVNIMLHAVNSVLLFVVASMLFGNAEREDKGVGTAPYSARTFYLFSAFIAAVIFALHPIHTESVAWVKGRDDLMALFFTLLAFIFYLWSTDPYETTGIKKVHPGFYLLALFLYLCAVLSKEMSITLPLVLVLHDYLFGNRINKGVNIGKHRKPETLSRFPDRLPVMRYIPFFLLAFSFLIVRTAVLGQVGQMESSWTGETLSNFFTMMRGIVYYIKLLILPVNLSVDYGSFPISHSMDWKVSVSLFLLSSIMLIAFLCFKYIPVISFSLLWFFITILPVTNVLVPVKIPIAERFLYIPSVGYCLLCGFLLGASLKYFMKREILFAKYMTYLLLFIIALLFSLGSFQRNLVWRDGQTLWTSEKRRFPDNMRAYRELGNYYRRAGMLEKAVTEYKEVLRLNPELTLIRSNLGGIYGMMGRLEEAIRELKIVLATDPDNVKARYNLALAYVQLEQCDAAVGELTYLLTLDPQNQSARKLIRECPLSGKE